VYFTESGVNKIGRLIPATGITQWIIPTPNSVPVGIIVGSNGNLYFTEKSGSKIGMLPVGGGPIAELPVPTPASLPDKITKGGEGAVWFTERAGVKVGRLN
jgi:virginiamycin B lyase